MYRFLLQMVNIYTNDIKNLYAIASCPHIHRYPHEKKNTIVIYSKYYSVFEPYYSKVYYTVYIIVFTTLC